MSDWEIRREGAGVRIERSCLKRMPGHFIVFLGNERYSHSSSLSTETDCKR